MQVLYRSSCTVIPSSTARHRVEQTSAASAMPTKRDFDDLNQTATKDALGGADDVALALPLASGNEHPKSLW